jgi:hypothetical protein
MTLAQLAVSQCPDRFPLSATFSSILDFGRDAIVGSPIWNVASAGGAAAWDIASQRVPTGQGIRRCGSPHEPGGLRVADVIVILSQLSDYALGCTLSQNSLRWSLIVTLEESFSK